MSVSPPSPPPFPKDAPSGSVLEPMDIRLPGKGVMVTVVVVTVMVVVVTGMVVTLR